MSTVFCQNIDSFYLPRNNNSKAGVKRKTRFFGFGFEQTNGITGPQIVSGCSLWRDRDYAYDCSVDNVIAFLYFQINHPPRLGNYLARDRHTLLICDPSSFLLTHGWPNSLAKYFLAILLSCLDPWRR